jgi:Fe-S-cluster containining protein
MLVGRPCPFLATDSEGHATCGAYAARPYNCRRFGCYRPDPSTEAYDAGGPLGCRNLSDRLDTSPAVVEAYRQAQTHAAEWAAAHGWQED